MAHDVHERMVEGALALLARKGLQGASFSEVIAATGAPRGSLYHHFPGGKDQMVGEALEKASQLLIQALRTAEGHPAPAVVERFLAIWRAVLQRSDCESGCAVLAVTVATHEPEQLQLTARIFQGWQSELARLLHRGGMPKAEARHFATLLIASAEGAVVMARATQSLAPLEAVSGPLLAMARAATAD